MRIIDLTITSRLTSFAIKMNQNFSNKYNEGDSKTNFKDGKDKLQLLITLRDRLNAFCICKELFVVWDIVRPEFHRQPVPHKASSVNNGQDLLQVLCVGRIAWEDVKEWQRDNQMV